MLYTIGIALYCVFWHTPWGTKVLSRGVDMLMYGQKIKGISYLLGVTIIPLILLVLVTP